MDPNPITCNEFMREAATQYQERARVAYAAARYAYQCASHTQAQGWKAATMAFMGEAQRAQAQAAHLSEQAREFYDVAYYRPSRTYTLIDPNRGGEEGGGIICDEAHHARLRPAQIAHLAALHAKAGGKEGGGIDPRMARALAHRAGKSNYAITAFLAAAERGEAAKLVTAKGTFTFEPATDPRAGAKDPGGSKK